MHLQRIILLVLLAFSVWAAPTSAIKGYVLDASRAGVPNATVILTDIFLIPSSYGRQKQDSTRKPHPDVHNLFDSKA
jgi:hypothetical protein